jgi:hypothetical protein
MISPFVADSITMDMQGFVVRTVVEVVRWPRSRTYSAANP